MFAAKKGKIARWATTLQECDLTIRHKSGAEMMHVDALSRLEKRSGRSHGVCPVTINQVDSPLPSLRLIQEEQSHVPNTEVQRFGLVLEQGLLFHPKGDSNH
ncbi:carbohydrate esterase family 8 protein [Gregarina niphandrodes]|uniref:Carbohydrate esterase family 8 protein n=1 Tax=Gregarina niphandrodes TaxID=110365 RepID=A0A023AVW9_GRENI|nr:carbohydrate esterase family 8 protein [Gregarina niphandrodes]EZG42762.1 carbohydrate esterase family 8 protein [Gregarina niphandrodes]|eukprot:XP_011133959.1 carbohydrate esterase family 8 protein [Gregarina niphandrodes]